MASIIHSQEQFDSLAFEISAVFDTIDYSNNSNERFIREGIQHLKELSANGENKHASTHYYMRKGYKSYYQSRYKQAAMYFDSANYFATFNIDSNMQFKSNANAGALYYTLGEYSSALVNYINGVKIATEFNPSALPTLYSNIGMLYNELGMLAKAEEYLIKNLDLLEEQNVSNEEKIKVYNVLGMIERKRKNYEAAEKWLLRAKDLAQEFEAYRDLGDIYNNLAVLEAVRENKDKELPYLKKSFDAYEKSGFLESIHTASYGLALYYFENNDFSTASSYVDQILAELHLFDANYQYNYQFHELYAKLLYEQGKYREAYDVGLIASLYRDSMQQEMLLGEAEKIELKYAVEQANKLDSLQRLEEEQRQAMQLQRIESPKKFIDSLLHEYFILYLPKDIVAGDFYFVDNVEIGDRQLIYVVAADCTGHGVPGAMVSIVGANAIKRCIQELGLEEPGEILDKLSKMVAANFSQSEETIRDGMDLALCCIEKRGEEVIKVHYAGANNPLWVINPKRKVIPENASAFREGGGFEIKANKQAIGYTEKTTSFATHTFDVEKGDVLYTFSDGFADQFGGEKEKKYKSANFRKFLLSIQDKDMDEQKSMINQEFNNWKGELEQIDDLCVIGVRL